MDEMNKVTGELLKEVSDWTDDSTKSAYNIRQDGAVVPEDVQRKI